MNEIDGFIEFIREIQIHPVINYQNNLPEHQ
jgi:hypothetical protein